MRFGALSGIALTSALPALAGPFYYRYDATNTYPEEQGWIRQWQDPKGMEIRTLHDGLLDLDTRDSAAIFDLYDFGIPELLPNEEIRVSWQMETLETDTLVHGSDVSLALVNGEGEYVQFFLATDRVLEWQSGGPGQMHEFQYQSGFSHVFSFISNMQSYALLVDGVPAFGGTFHDFAWGVRPRITFGDAITGLRSRSQWDFVEVSIVPEPAFGFLAGLAVLHALRRIK